MDNANTNNRKAINRNCPLCQEPTVSAPLCRYSDSVWNMKTCPKCSMVYLDAFPVYEELAEDYSWEKTSSQHKTSKKKKYPILNLLSKMTKWRLKLFKRQHLAKLYKLIPAGNTIDIGCGRGGYLQNIPEKYIPYGIEIAQNEAKLAHQRVQARGGKVSNKPAVEGMEEFPDDFASGIIMHAFLEHEPWPLSVLEHAYRVLQDDGRVIIKVPNYGCFNRTVLGKKWSGFRFPDHLNYFTPKTLVKMCEKAGFSIEKFNFKDKFPFSDNMWMVLNKIPQ